MSNNSRLIMFSIAFLLVIAISTFQVIPVYADGEVPPPTPTPEVTPTAEVSPSPESPTEAPPVEPVATEVPPTEGTPTEVPATEEAPVVQDSPVAESTSPSETTADLLARVPEGTDVVVLDQNGEVLSLATEEAAQMVYNGDPIWCPATVLVPVNNGAGCSPSFGSMLEVITYLTNNPKSVAGVIWIAKGYDSSVNELPGTTALTLDGSLMGTTANFAITLKGGWNGFGTGTVNTTDPSEFNIPLSITDWNANVTLSDILITDATGANGLSITTTKNVRLDRVKVQNTVLGSGATIDNTIGTGSVIVNSSQFNNNAGSGLTVYSDGSVTLSSLTASNNQGGFGAWINNSTASPLPMNVTMTGISELNGNLTYGLWITSKGAITLTNVTANENSGTGANLENNAGTAGVTLNGTNIFNENTDYGLQVVSKGAIKINNAIANSNIAGGAYLNNTLGTAKPVTLTGTSQFKYNGQNGLYIVSAGLVTLSNIIANSNSASGLNVDNTGGTLGVTLTGTNIFNSNQNEGLRIQTKGTISIANVTASYNGLTGTPAYGAYLNNSTGNLMPVVFAGKNIFNGNSLSGLFVVTRGAISSAATSSLTANDSVNGGGIQLSNTASGTATPRAVTLLGPTTVNNNKFTGLDVVSYGLITVTKLTAVGNGSGGAGYYGAYLHNDGAAPPAGVVPPGVRLLGASNISDNFGDGLRIVSKGAITVSYLTANNNGLGGSGGVGAYLKNDSSTSAPQNVTLAGRNVFSNNYANGLEILTYGAVTLNSITANSNGLGAGAGYGAVITNNTGTLARNVLLTGTNNFSGNYSMGLSVNSKGAITVYNVTANDTVNGSGVSLANNLSAAPQKISVIGTNVFNNNNDDGLHLVSKGPITLNSITAMFNGGDGADVDNNEPGALGGVSLTGLSYFTENDGTGLRIQSLGNVSLQKVTADGNGQSGLMVATPGKVTLTCGSFTNNTVYGWSVSNASVLTLTAVVSSGNGTANTFTSGVGSVVTVRNCPLP